MMIKQLLNRFNVFLFVAALAGLASCSEDDEITFKELTPAGEITETVWSANTTVYIESDVVVPAGSSLTIEAGTQVIFKGDNLGTADAPEFQVRGNLYVLGTESNPVVFSVETAQKTEENQYIGLWGGIQCASTCEELALVYAEISYTGAPAGANSIFVEQGEDEGDPRFGVTFANPEGKYVCTHSTFMNTADDATRVLAGGGQCLFTYNTFAFCGGVGGEAINIKSGTKGDMAFNVFYSVATNGTKWSNSGDLSPQTECNSYNNTFVNCGWRRNKEGRGGSVNIEKSARGASYNQLIVNCKYGVRVVGGEDAADSANVIADYSYYYGNEQQIVDEFIPSNGILPYLNNTLANDVQGAVGENDPMFADFDVTLSKSADVALASIDLHLQSGSAALTGAYTDFSPVVSSLTVGGVTYSAPAPAEYFGAFGTK